MLTACRANAEDNWQHTPTYTVADLFHPLKKISGFVVIETGEVLISCLMTPSFFFRNFISNSVLIFLIVKEKLLAFSYAISRDLHCHFEIYGAEYLSWISPHH